MKNKTKPIKEGWEKTIKQALLKEPHRPWHEIVFPIIRHQLSLAEQEGGQEERTRIEKNIGQLRQWLNEKPADMLVTNSCIEMWLGLTALEKKEKK